MVTKSPLYQYARFPVRDQWLQLTSAAWIQAYNLKTAVWPSTSQIGTRAIGIAIGTFKTSQRVLAVLIREEGYLTGGENMGSVQDQRREVLHSRKGEGGALRKGGGTMSRARTKPVRAAAVKTRFGVSALAPLRLCTTWGLQRCPAYARPHPV